MRPSFLSHILNGLLLLVATIMFFYNYQNLSTSYITLYVILLSIAIGIHGLLHLGQEVYFNYNPLTGDTIMYDKPIFSK